jgi:hypothetical protein
MGIIAGSSGGADKWIRMGLGAALLNIAITFFEIRKWGIALSFQW